MSTTLQATVDALGHPTGFHLTGGEAADLVGADVLVPQLAAPTVSADKGDEAAARVLTPLCAAGKTAVLPPKRNRTTRRAYNRHLYHARPLIENIFCNRKQYRASATRYDKTTRNFFAAAYCAAMVILPTDDTL